MDDLLARKAVDEDWAGSGLAAAVDPREELEIVRQVATRSRSVRSAEERSDRNQRTSDTFRNVRARRASQKSESASSDTAASTRSGTRNNSCWAEILEAPVLDRGACLVVLPAD
jgi:hypothetical protein